MALALVGTCTDVPNQPSKPYYGMEIIHNSATPRVVDSTYYHHDPTWTAFFDTTAADSFANVLFQSSLDVSDFWFPEGWQSLNCATPLRPGMEIIVKLAVPDSVGAAALGLQRGINLAFGCVYRWRHYIFAKD